MADEKDKRAHVRSMSGGQLSAVQQNLRSEATFNNLYEQALASNLEAVETLNDVLEVVASRRAAWQRGFIMNLLSLKSAGLAFSVLTGKAKLKPSSISERAVTGRSTEIGFQFFRTGTGHGKVPGVKSIEGNVLPVYFFPEKMSLTVAAYTPLSVGADLHTLADKLAYAEVRKASYGLVTQPTILNADINLQIGSNIYLQETKLTDLGINYWVDRKRGMLPIDTMLISAASSEIKASIVTEEITLANNLILNLDIQGVCIMP